MNFVNQLKNKTVTYGIGVLGAIIALVALIIDIAYVSMGGTNLIPVYLLIVAGIAINVFLFFYDGVFADLLAMLAPVVFTVAAAMELYWDYGNIVDMMNNIKMYGNASLGVLNIVIAVLLLAGSILALVACFTRRSRRKKIKNI